MKFNFNIYRIRFQAGEVNAENQGPLRFTSHGEMVHWMGARRRGRVSGASGWRCSELEYLL